MGSADLAAASLPRRRGAGHGVVRIATLVALALLLGRVVAGAGLLCAVVLVAAGGRRGGARALPRGVWVIVLGLGLVLADRYGPAGRPAPLGAPPSEATAAALLVALAATLSLSSTGTPSTARRGSGSEAPERVAEAASEEQARALASDSRLPMWLSGPSGRRSFVNASWTEFTGRTFARASPDEAGAGLHTDDRARVEAVRERSSEQVEPYEIEYRLLRFDGAYRWMLERAWPRFTRDGRFQGFVAACVDIHERHLREASIEERRAELARLVEEKTAELHQANAELSRAARLKDEFLANVSHELRTPLTAVLGFTETLLTEVQGPLTPAQRRALETVEESGRHLLSLITEILDLAKIDAGRMTVEMNDDVGVDGLCQSSLRIVKEAAQKKKVHLTYSRDPLLTRVAGDGLRLKQVLVNLLANAIKFTPPGGSVGLEAVSDVAGRVARLTVWDTGIGIHRDDQARLFQPFVQVDGSITRRYGGTGLGLALARRMVELHGGQVLLGSEPGRGSRFTVVLPWTPSEPDVEAAPPPTDEPASDAARPRHARILLVEDHDDLVAMLTDYLESRGHHVLAAQTADSGVALALRERPDLILMDVQLDGTDGIEAIRRLRADAALQATPILALTAMAMPGDRERCLSAGATDYVSKPLRLGDLMECVERCMAPGRPS